MAGATDFARSPDGGGLAKARVAARGHVAVPARPQQPKPPSQRVRSLPPPNAIALHKGGLITGAGTPGACCGA